MRCEFCNERVEADWWALTVHNVWAWLCDRHKETIAAKDEAGKVVAMPAAEKMGELHDRA